MTQIEANLMCDDVDVALLLLPTTVPGSWAGAAATSCLNALTEAANNLQALRTEADQAAQACKRLDLALS